MRRFYTVADFCFAVALAGDRDPDRYLASFAAFKSGGCPEDEKLFELSEDDTLQDAVDAEFLEEDSNDMGHTMLYRTPEGYRIELRYADGTKPHVVETDRGFIKVKALIRWEDRYAATALISMLRIVFAQAILPYEAISLHSSVVVNEGRAFLFMGKSGTGKSTHSTLWLRHIEGTELLNDDNPVVRLVDGKAMAYGSPWSGKTPCYRNESAPVAAMVRLKQGPRNRFEPLEDIAAFGALLPGCSVLRQDGRLHDMLCMTLTALIETVCVGGMECLPDKEAAEVCRREALKDLRLI
ncbi:MAG: phosphoenolpyruvate carboxykinase [Bacteroidales bacterium]|nr:phosphoenolpyruvate carboxykinase [Bacteroidales bacterium]